MSGLNATQTAGVPGTVTVTAKDTFGNTATGYLGTVALGVGVADGAATLPSHGYTAGNAGVFAFAGGNAFTLTKALTQTLTAGDGTPEREPGRHHGEPGRDVKADRKRVYDACGGGHTGECRGDGGGCVQ